MIDCYLSKLLHALVDKEQSPCIIYLDEKNIPKLSEPSSEE